MSKKVQHVVPNADGKWAVRRAGSERAGRIFATKSEAVDYARTIVKKEQGEVFIHSRDGTIREHNTYGSDPYPPREKATS